MTCVKSFSKEIIDKIRYGFGSSNRNAMIYNGLDIYKVFNHPDGETLFFVYDNRLWMFDPSYGENPKRLNGWYESVLCLEVMDFNYELPK